MKNVAHLLSHIVAPKDIPNDSDLLRESKESFQHQIVDLINFVNGKTKKYVAVGKKISTSFKFAQPEVSSFIHLGDTLIQS